MNETIFNPVCFNADVHPADFMQVAEAVMNYIRFDWCYDEFATLFPGIAYEYMWNERGDDFVKFYGALSEPNKHKVMNRIMEKRYLNITD